MKSKSLNSVCKKTLSGFKKTSGSRLVKPKKTECTGVHEYFLGKRNAEPGVFLEPLNRFKEYILTMLAVLLVLCVDHQANAQHEDLGMTNRTFYYSGLIGVDDKVELNLQLKGLVISGSYIMERTGDLFVFTGRMAPDRSTMGLIIFDDQDQYIASFDVKLISGEHNFGKEIKGRWKSADGNTTLEVSFKKVAEFALAPLLSKSTMNTYTGE